MEAVNISVQQLLIPTHVTGVGGMAVNSGSFVLENVPRCCLFASGTLSPAHLVCSDAGFAASVIIPYMPELYRCPAAETMEARGPG